jgi:hypothetical protein
MKHESYGSTATNRPFGINNPHEKICLNSRTQQAQGKGCETEKETTASGAGPPRQAFETTFITQRKIQNTTDLDLHRFKFFAVPSSGGLSVVVRVEKGSSTNAGE